MFNYRILENKHSGFQVIQLTEEPYKDIMYTYGKVDFLEPETEDGDAKISFEYELVEDIDTVYSTDDFKQYIGDILVELIQKGLEENDISYTGGIDE